MIFDNMNSATPAFDINSVQESAYELGLEGGMMHVYENECNFNAIMKAAGIAECNYYREYGEDIWVNEAGAAGGLFERFINFFKSVIKKIQEMFKKLFMKISSYVASDKTFVNKYKSKVFANFKQFKFKGYKNLLDIEGFKLDPSYLDLNFKDVPTPEQIANDSQYANKITDEDIEKELGALRADLAGKSGELDSKEFQTEFKKLIYGDDKEEFDVSATIVKDCFDIISDTKKNIKAITKVRDDFTRGVNNYIKNLEKARDIVLKSMDTKTDSGDALENKGNVMNGITKAVTLAKGGSQIITTAVGMGIGAIKDANRQAKAICVKALNSGSKKSTEESATLVDDIFAGVNII